MSDAHQLESALLNLAINARDAMAEGGTLTIATADRALTRRDLAGHDEVEPGHYVEIAVTDTGAGMSPDVLARAFEPFFTTKPTGQGTGLGLSQVYGFVRQSGGLVQLESEPGHGAAVRLFLPRHEPSSEARRETGEAPSDAGRPAGAAGKTVLVVDDVETVRDQIAETLREMGCAVLEAADGPAGLRILERSGRLDLLVTDVGLPGLNGRQLADAARAKRPTLPVLLITGYAGAALENMRLGPGMGILAKPFSLDALAARVSAMLEDEPARV
jgi:CheY-like chemotaxis protein